jgi:uncharacterized protein YciI
MKSFLILYQGKTQETANDSLIKAHSDYLKKLSQENLLPICGPLIDYQNAIMVIRAKSESEAKQLIDNDPLIQNHYYQQYSINEMTEANEENQWFSLVTQKPKRKDSSFSSFFSNQNFSNSIKNKPLTMSVLFRKMKDGNGYEDFRKAWLPPVEPIENYFNLPVMVINAQNLQEPEEVISVGLVWADVEEAMQKYLEHQKTEAERQDKIELISDQSQDTKLCKILDIDVLGT